MLGNYAAYCPRLCTSAMNKPPIPIPTAMIVAPSITSPSRFRWSPITTTINPTATGVAPTENNAAPGMNAQQMLTMATRLTAPDSVYLACGFDTVSERDMT